MITAAPPRLLEFGVGWVEMGGKLDVAGEEGNLLRVNSLCRDLLRGSLLVQLGYV